VGALGHYLESEELATASISLIRPHTEKIRPPRALWVPFELGRPLGVPNDAAFQRRVLEALLRLLEKPAGPVLEDYPEDGPTNADTDMTGMACPISFEAPASGEETLAEAVAREIRQLRPWYDLSLERRGRTTFGGVGLEIEQVADLLCSWLNGDGPESPRTDMPPEVMLKLCSEDLKAFYLEATAAQPQTMSARQLADWLWGETAAARLLVTLRERCIKDEDPAIRLIGLNNLVPREQWGRFGITERWWRAK
jgi:hypothetical protein